LNTDRKNFRKGRAERALFYLGNRLGVARAGVDARAYRIRGRMTKANTGKAGKSSKQSRSAPKKALKQVDLGLVRERITNPVGNRALEMVETTMDEVAKGHYLAMKYLFEMIGLCPATAPEEALQEDSLARTLLRRLRLPEETTPSTEVTTDCLADAVEQESDAVK
jgi:hypothetical protein